VELAEAQKRTELRVEELALAQTGLAEAQKRTELRVEELALAQTGLAEAQKRTELRVEELALAQTGLAEAQKRTELRLEQLVVVVQRLTQEHEETRRQLGGLTITIGYTLENAAFKALPELLRRDFGMIVTGRLKRGYVTDNRGQAMEVNILGEAIKDGQAVVIVGESKSQLSKNAVDDFIARRLGRLQGVFAKEMFPVMITHMTSAPDVEEYTRAKGIALYYSYDL
jgi:hypothetical protein